MVYAAFAMPTGTPLSEATIRAAVLAVEEGSTWREAADAHGFASSTLRKRAGALGIGPRRGRQLFSSPLRLKLPSDPADLGYLAGIIDGEGWISVRHGTPSVHRVRIVVRVGVTNTDKTLIDWLSAIGGGVSVRAPDGYGRKVIYNWDIAGRRDALALLEAVEPYLRIKRDRARHGIAILQEAMELDRKNDAWLMDGLAAVLPAADTPATETAQEASEPASAAQAPPETASG